MMVIPKHFSDYAPTFKQYKGEWDQQIKFESALHVVSRNLVSIVDDVIIPILVASVEGEKYVQNKEAQHHPHHIVIGMEKPYLGVDVRGVKFWVRCHCRLLPLLEVHVLMKGHIDGYP